MLRGYRGIVAALAGLILISASPSAHGAGGQQQRAQAEISQSLERIGNALEEANKPKRETADCSDGKEDRKSDLCAQWKAADAAAKGADAAEETNVIGWIGVVLGAITMGAAIAAAYFAKKAADHTEAGARAADAAVLETRRIGEAQTSAYLRAVLGGGIVFLPPVWTSFGTILIENTGMTPAFNVRGSARVIAVDSNWQETVSHDSKITGGMIPAHGGEGQGTLFWDALPHHLKVGMDGDHWLMLRGTLIWDDVFEIERSFPFELVGKIKARPDDVGYIAEFTESAHKMRRPT